MSELSTVTSISEEQFRSEPDRAILKTSQMEKHSENMSYLLHMIAVLRERQSSWQLTAYEREATKKGIEALEAAKDALSIQIYA